MIIYRSLRKQREILGRRIGSVPKHLAWLSGAGLLLLVALTAMVWKRPDFGLLGIIFVPLFIGQLVLYFARRRNTQVDTLGLGFLFGLSGLLKAGVSLPNAVLQLTRGRHSAFEKSLGFFLQDFRNGRSLTECLTQFRKNEELRTMGISLAFLEMAYRNGFSLGALLDRLLPSLQTDLDNHARIRSIRKTGIYQGLFGMLLPWFLMAFLFALQPELTQDLWQRATWYCVIFVSVILEGVGFLLLWQLCRFY